MEPRRTAVIVSAVVLVGGLVAMALGGWAVLGDPADVSVVGWPAYVLGQAIATMGLVILVSSLTSPRVVQDQSTTHYPGGVRAQAQLRIDGSGAGLLPVIIFGLSAALMLVLTLLLRDGFPSNTWMLFGLFAAFIIGYWGFRSFRSYRTRRGTQ